MKAALLAAVLFLSPAASVTDTVHPAGNGNFCLSVTGEDVGVAWCGEQGSMTWAHQQWAITTEDGEAVIAWAADSQYCLGVQRSANLAAGLVKCTAKPVLHISRQRDGWVIGLGKYVLSAPVNLADGYTYPAAWRLPQRRLVQEWIIPEWRN